MTRLDSPGMAFPVTSDHDERDRLRYRMFSDAESQDHRDFGSYAILSLLIGKTSLNTWSGCELPRCLRFVHGPTRLRMI